MFADNLLKEYQNRRCATFKFADFIPIYMMEFPEFKECLRGDSFPYFTRQVEEVHPGQYSSNPTRLHREVTGIYNTWEEWTFNNRELLQYFTVDQMFHNCVMNDENYNWVDEKMELNALNEIKQEVSIYILTDIIDSLDYSDEEKEPTDTDKLFLIDPKLLDSFDWQTAPHEENKKEEYNKIIVEEEEEEYKLFIEREEEKEYANLSNYAV